MHVVLPKYARYLVILYDMLSLCETTNVFIDAFL